MKIINMTESSMTKREAIMLLPAITYDSFYYRQGRFKKERIEYKKKCILKQKKDEIIFWTGLIPRLKEFSNKNNLGIEFPKIERVEGHKHPHLKGIQFRLDQLKLMKKAIVLQQGMIISATGTGKTLLQLGIISAFPDRKWLILAHTVDLVKQTYEEIKKYDVNSVAIMTGQHVVSEIPHENIVVSTVQTFKKFIKADSILAFTGVIVDEAHHVNKQASVYSDVLSALKYTTIRLGFTATKHPTTEGQLVSEGLLGPIIGEFKINTAVDKKVLATPKIKILKSPFNQRVKDTQSYQSVYQKGIVVNRQRNELIKDEVKSNVADNKSCLIMVNKIEHGELISELLNEYNIENIFIHGSTDGQERDNIKELLMDKKLLCVIATTIWKEGINIPSLDVIINAAGGKSEIAVFQAIGRGLRRTSEKGTVTIVDFFDPSHNYLIAHFGERFSLYCENKWI